VTDGEFRRLVWALRLPVQARRGVELVSVAQGLQFKGTQTKAEGLHVHGKIDFSSTHPMLRALPVPEVGGARHAKMTIPSPTALHFRGWRAGDREVVYPEMEPFFEDLGNAYTKAVRAFGEAAAPTCSSTRCYVAIFADDNRARCCRDRGDDPDELLHRLCRPGERCLRRPHAGHDHQHASLPRQLPLDLDGAGRLRARAPTSCSTSMNVDAYFMEYDTERRRRLRAAAPAAARKVAACWA
jgi:5-methyltetrahydropteroyltriglutamate--homocysteine methyltransferase